MIHGKRVLITGGAGMIGSTIADRIVDLEPAEIVVVDNLVRGRMANLDAAMSRFPTRRGSRRVLSSRRTECSPAHSASKRSEAILPPLVDWKHKFSTLMANGGDTRTAGMTHRPTPRLSLLPVKMLS